MTGTRRATIWTRHDEPDAVAGAIAPDNTDQMDASVEDGAVVTRIERGTTGGLHSTVDDYVVNLGVAQRVVRLTNDPDASASDPEHEDNS